MNFLMRSKEKMKALRVCFSMTRSTGPIREAISHRSGETSGDVEPPASEDAAPSSEIVLAAAAGDDGETGSDERPLVTTSSGEGERKRELMEKPPTDDVCPICFGDFDVPCRAPCGHWYCAWSPYLLRKTERRVSSATPYHTTKLTAFGYWNFSAALQPCKCPMCLQPITKLTPEASFYYRNEGEISKVLRSVADYNCLFLGGLYGFMLKILAIPLFIKRMFRAMLNADRPGVHLQEMRMIAVLLGVLYSMTPFDFLQIGRRNIINVFELCAFALSFILYLVGLYLRRRRHRRNIRELVIQD